jgi:hypothetical protein
MWISFLLGASGSISGPLLVNSRNCLMWYKWVFEGKDRRTDVVYCVVKSLFLYLDSGYVT